MMGWGAKDFKSGQLGLILDGHIPDRDDLHDLSNFLSWGTSGHVQPSIADTVHCMCLVVPCDAASDDTYMARLREMRQLARDRGEHLL